MGEKSENIHMVDVGDKPIIHRTATASGRIYLKPETIEMIRAKKIKKGDPLTVAEIAAIQAVKQTPLLVPLCHQIPITKVQCKAEIYDDFIEASVFVRSDARTGVEMEAIVGVSMYLTTIWDMTKYLEKDENGQYPSTRISDIHVVRKEKTPL